MSAPTIISKETMTAGFPPTIQQITGTPTLGDLFRACRHLMYCAQSQFTTYHVFNWLFLVVSPNMWNIHLVDAYPIAPANPGLVPRYGNTDSPLSIINVKDAYNIGNKTFQEDANMNCALTERFFYRYLPPNTHRPTTRYLWETQDAVSAKLSPIFMIYLARGTSARSNKIATA